MRRMSLFAGVVVSAMGAALSLPTAIGRTVFPDLGFLAWVALVPLYLVTRTSRPWEGFRYAFLWAAVYYGAALYWIYLALHHYGDVPMWGSLLGTLLAVLVVSSILALAMGLVLIRKQERYWWLLFPLMWVLQDFVRTVFPFGGFPWASLGYSQRSHPYLLQCLDITGIYGVTFLIVLANALAAEVCLWLRKTRRFPREIVILPILLASVLIYGKLRYQSIQKDAAARPQIRLTLIQGNIPQDEKWLEEMVDEIINRHIYYTRQAEREQPDLIVWPEAAFPAAIPPDWRKVDSLSDLKIPLLMGVVTYEGEVPEEWPPPPETTTFTLHNSAMFIGSGGWIQGVYHKNHLVPMGEYVPLQEVFFFLNKIVPAVSSFSPGRTLNLLTASLKSGLTVRLGVTICYEDLFPSISREFVRQGADVLVNLTNDAWYETSSALYQHFDFSRFRAIEERRAMVRATNTGVSGYFGPAGDVLAEAPVLKETTLSATIPLGGVTSFYSRFGDVFVWCCFAALGVILARRS